ncbi:MAG: peptidylprolyl isomerase [Chloroflexota bacterium]
MTILLLALGLTACASFVTPATPAPTETPAPPTATPVPAAATVNGEVVPLAEFEAELARYRSAMAALGKSVSDEEASKIVLDELIDQVLLAQGARAAGFDLTEADLQSRIDALADSIGGAERLSAWQSAHGYDESSFRIALRRAAEAAWMRDKIVADVPGTAEQVHVQQILAYNEDAARRALEQLQAGVDFDEVAVLYDPATRGDLGWFPRGYLLEPKIEEAAFNLQVGQYSEVIATEIGFHIIKVLERGDHPLSPDALLTVQEQAVREWLAGQRLQAQIVLAP